MLNKLELIRTCQGLKGLIASANEADSTISCAHLGFLMNLQETLEKERDAIPDYPYVGCHIDGNSQNVLQGCIDLIELAQKLGMPEVKFDFDVENANYCDYKDVTLTSEQCEEIEEAALEAEQWLSDNRNEVAYAYWGWHEGNFGLWPSVSAVEDDAWVHRNSNGPVVKVADVPDYIMEVNDHGNVTLYEITGKREVWSQV